MADRFYFCSSVDVHERRPKDDVKHCSVNIL